MATIVSATEVLAAEGGGMYLNADEKAALHNEQRPFWIVNAVGEQDGQFGPQSVFFIREKGKDDAKLAFGVTEARKDFCANPAFRWDISVDHLRPTTAGDARGRRPSPGGR